MTKGVRFINGREYLLAGVLESREDANREANSLRQQWADVRIRSRRNLIFSIWVHGKL